MPRRARAKRFINAERAGHLQSEFESVAEVQRGDIMGGQSIPKQDMLPVDSGGAPNLLTRAVSFAEVIPRVRYRK
jgi:hypothetical protein